MTGARLPNWVGYVAAALLLAHAVLSYYWAAGGTLGLGLLAGGVQEMAEDRVPWFIALVWGVAVLKTGLAALALALTRGWALPLPRWSLLLVTWTAGIVLALYALTQLVTLTIVGLILDAGERSTGFWPYLLLWAPLWLAIGIALLLTAWRATAIHAENPR